MYIWNGGRLWWDELITKNTYKYTLQASVENVGSGTPEVYYGGALATGGLPSPKDGSVKTLSVVLNSNLESGSITIDVAINDILQGQQLEVSSGRTSIIDFSPSLSVTRGDLITIAVTDNGSSGGSAGVLVLELEV